MPWENDQMHAFASQWQLDSGTYLVPKLGYIDTNYRTDQTVPTRIADDAFIVDHLDGYAQSVEQKVSSKLCVHRTVRYFDNYMDTLKRIAKNADKDGLEYVWILSSVCDYENFDFSWHPDPWQRELLHVFPSNEQKFGDTFLMHVPTFNERIHTRELLEWYDLNFVDISVHRRSVPVVQHSYNSHMPALAENFSGPVALFTVRDSVDIDLPTVNLWRERTKTVVPLSPNRDTALIPKTAIGRVTKQMYDYEYIDKQHQNSMDPVLQDIVFISYDEPEADANYAKLLERFPRAKRVHGVKGMERALARAAEVSETPWYFAVFGKTELYPEFQFDFQPDYFQEPKHYIFHSINRVNDLIYGEMAVILYNCKLILDHQGKEFGLDFTMSFPHEVIPEISSYGNFDTSPYHAWRTAFREVSKLYDIQSRTPSIETKHRIHVWETVAKGEYAEWVLNGARDGREFYKKYADDYQYRKNSFDWQWLRNYFLERYIEA